MAIPFTSQQVNDWRDYTRSGWINVKTAGTLLKNAGNNSLWSSARYSVYDAGVALQDAVTCMRDDGGTNSLTELYNMLIGILNNWPEGGSVTMPSILAAMMLAKFDELVQFIGLEQAFMAAMWNAPYNGEYYAALARGFRKWP